jgi:hypothetical protein
MFKVPAHKQVDPDKLPGQIRNETTLGQYIARKTDAPVKKKLTFEEWFELSGYGNKDVCRHTWKAAQENV